MVSKWLSASVGALGPWKVQGCGILHLWAILSVLTLWLACRVSVQNWDSWLDWVVEICQLWQLLYSILEMFSHSRKPSTPKTSTLHLSVVTVPVHLQKWFPLISTNAMYQQSTTHKRPLTIVCLACKEALVFGYTATYKRAQYCLFFLQTGSCVLLFYHL